MKGRLSTILALLVILALSLTLIPSCAKGTPTPTATTATKTLKIGCSMAFSGPASAWGDAIKPQMQIYADLINRDGGLKVGNDTYKIELSWADDQYSADGASTAAKQLVYNDKVQFYVGFFGASAPAVDAITEPEKVIFLGKGWAPYPDWDATQHPYTFWGTPSYTFLSSQAFAIVNAYPKTKKMGIILGQGVGSDVLANTIAANLKTVGVDTVIQYYSATSDFTTYLTKLNDAGIDCLYTLGSTGENALMCKQRYELGYKWPVAQAGTLLDSHDFIAIAGQAASQGLLSDWPCPWTLKKVTVKPELVTMAKRIAAQFEKQYGKPMRYMGAFGYGLQHMSLLFAALQQAGSVDPDKVREVLWGGTFDTFLGKYTMSGQKTYNGPMAAGYPCEMSKIEGTEEVYAGEYTYIVP